MWSYLRGRQVENLKFRRQHPIGPFIVDFCCVEKRIVVELDGGQHREDEQYDARRTQILEERGYRVVRFWNGDVSGNLEGVLEQLVLELLR